MAKTENPRLIYDGDVPERCGEGCGLVDENGRVYAGADGENLLISGDNLCALKALAGKYAGRIKCVYMDPPYNTGGSFDHYDDRFSHGEWLGFMKRRLCAVKPLLARDGVVAVQIGFDEMAYLKVLMDEVFGREKCVGQIAVRMSHSAGMKRRAMDRRMIKNTEYILIYYYEAAPRLRPVYEPCAEYPVNYYQYITRFPGEGGCETGLYCSLIDVLYEKFKPEFDAMALPKVNASIGALYAGSAAVRRFILGSKERVVRKDSNVPGTIPPAAFAGLGGREFTRHRGVRGDYYIGVGRAGRPYQLYAIADKVKRLPACGDAADEEGLTNLVGDWWDGFYRDMSRVDIEGGVKMKTSKKPERLIARLLRALTDEGDLILDPFLGSGTTAAVALKMRRRFIGIERGDQLFSLCVPRLGAVIAGDDPHGITRAENWNGGGSYRLLTCAPARLAAGNTRRSEE